MSDRRRSSSSRRDKSGSRRDRDSSSRRSSPGTSKARSPRKSRDENELPEEFGRGEKFIDEDETTVLKRMETAFTITPLNGLAEHLKTEGKLIKVWTRNYKEIRGISRGKLVAFDKHWNIVMSDVDDMYVKPKKNKTPYLLDTRIGDAFPELKPKVPKKKKEKKPKEENVEENVEKENVEENVEKENVEENAEKENVEENAEKENVETQKPVEEMSVEKKKREKKPRPFHRRQLPIVFIRGDSVVMIAIIFGTDYETATDALFLKH